MRLIIMLFAIALVWVQARLWFSDDGLRESWYLQDQLIQQSQINASLAERNQALEAEVTDLKQGVAAAEERARSELGMVRANETFYQIISVSGD